MFSTCLKNSNFRARSCWNWITDILQWLKSVQSPTVWSGVACVLSIGAGAAASVVGTRRAGQHRCSLAIELFSAFLQNTTILPKTFPEPEVKVTAALLNSLIFKIERRGGGGSFKAFHLKTWSWNSRCTAVFWFCQWACARSPSFKP